ncbi:hypothetical protein MASR2M117_07380 [Paludibacter sp.]
MEEIKENIIQASLTQFYQIGIRNVSIDDVCTELRMSKKTFYQYFKSIEDFIDAIIDYERQQQWQKVQKGIKDKNAIDIFVYMIKEMKKNTECMPFMFWHDLKKYYPALYQKHDRIKKDNIRMAFEQNIAKGIKEGYYRDNLDIELIAYFHSIQLSSTFDAMIQESQKKYTLKRLTNFFTDMIIHLIANEKGLKYISENLSDKK